MLDNKNDPSIVITRTIS